ncbi:YhcN/YlaJ family sporulation lipoprotein [Pseudogracilibacillus sp. SO30301A]|uniref:YhcN/YlaJ family sporulation lipoprotein n=1 Tax=Pseudogracilibacillus sp. SO30301A TaxID=3098291 RepID=UPI00300DF2C2
MNRYLFPILILTGIILASCNQNNAVPPREQTNNKIQVEQSSYEENLNLDNQEIASRLATIATEVPDVRDAAAIIAGPYAVVGIDIDESVERQRVGSIKYSVNEALQKDPYGKTAVVVADADMTERIREMGDKIQQGYPVRGVVDEVAEIVSRYMPSFPVPENRPQDEDENKQKVPEDERQKIEDIQRDQSTPE